MFYFLLQNHLHVSGLVRQTCTNPAIKQFLSCFKCIVRTFPVVLVLMGFFFLSQGLKSLLLEIIEISFRCSKLIIYMYTFCSNVRVQYQLGQNRTLKEDVIGDGLGDNVLSTVTLTRDKRKLEVIAFGGQADKKTIHIPGADDRLDINGNIYVGGYLNPKRDIPWKNRVNFKGCMIKAVFNDLDLLSGAPPNKKNGFTSERVRTTTSRNIPPKPMNFKKETFIKLEIQEIDTSDPTSYLTQLDGSLEFRTVLIAGTVFKATSVSLEFQKSQLMLKSGSTDLVSLPFPNGGSANDGRWFEVKFRVKDDLMEITLNNITNRIKPANRPEYGSQIILGYDENDEYRFIGCLRNIKLLGVEITYQKIIDPYRQTPFAEKGELEEGCKASDPCVPNPCFHEAECLSYAKGIDCDCKKKYKKPLCQFCKYYLGFNKRLT